MPSKAINNDDNNDLTSNNKKEKQPLVKNKQSEEQLQIGQDFETEVLEKNEAIMSSLTPTKQKLDEQLSKAKGKKKKGKEKKIGKTF